MIEGAVNVGAWMSLQDAALVIRAHTALCKGFRFLRVPCGALVFSVFLNTIHHNAWGVVSVLLLNKASLPSEITGPVSH